MTCGFCERSAAGGMPAKYQPPKYSPQKQARACFQQHVVVHTAAGRKQRAVVKAVEG